MKLCLVRILIPIHLGGADAQGKEFMAIRTGSDFVVIDGNAYVWLSSNQASVLKEKEVGFDDEIISSGGSLLEVMGAKPREILIKF